MTTLTLKINSNSINDVKLAVSELLKEIKMLKHMPLSYGAGDTIVSKESGEDIYYDWALLSKN